MGMCISLTSVPSPNQTAFSSSQPRNPPISWHFNPWLLGLLGTFACTEVTAAVGASQNLPSEPPVPLCSSTTAITALWEEVTWIEVEYILVRAGRAGLWFLPCGRRWDKH